MHLPEAGGWDVRGVPMLPLKPGNYALRSPQSRAAARSLLVMREANDKDESPGNLIGLAEAIRAARMKDRAGKFPASLPAIEGGQEWGGGGRADWLSERVRMTRERGTRAQSPATMP